MLKKVLILDIFPLILSTSIITSFMYIYKADSIVIFVLLSFILSYGMFLFYNFFADKGIVGKFSSILVGFLVIAIIYFAAVSGGTDLFDFVLWFMSPQGTFEESEKYIVMVFAGISFFVSSTIYYFTKIRYRIFVTFLILMIPLAIFAKENETIPFPLLAVLLISYLGVMVHCRHTADSEKNTKVNMILDNSYKKSVSFFIFASVIVSFIFPKPEIEARREYFENLISANDITQYLLDQLGEFTDTSSNSGASMSRFNRPLFYVRADEPMNLKTKTFSNYSYNDDLWYVNNSFDRSFEENWEERNTALNPAEFLNAVYTACQYDEKFSEKYNISYKNSRDYNLSEFTRTATVIPQTFYGVMLQSPTHIFNISRDDVLSTPSGTIVQPEVNNIDFTFSYYSDMLSDTEYARGVMNNLNSENYEEFLLDLYSVLLNNNADDKMLNILDTFIDDYTLAITYKNGEEITDRNFVDTLEVEKTIEGDLPSEKIKSLAEDITRGLESDIEKAEALEMYFFRNDYIYNAEYQKAEDANSDTFVFESKTGACYEYATAMVLMARSLGIPARYNEGFMLSDYDDERKIFTVTGEHSHAFPELFISGYGWLGFEPTISSMENESRVMNSEQLKITVFCIVSVVLFIGGFLFKKFVFPIIYEKYFRFKINKMSCGEVSSVVFKRLVKLTGTEKSVTADEFGKIFYEKYGMDISKIIKTFNLYTYGEVYYMKINRETLINLYIESYQLVKNL